MSTDWPTRPKINTSWWRLKFRGIARRDHRRSTTTAPSWYDGEDVIGGFGEHREVGERVAVEKQQVGSGTRQELADLTAHVEQVGGDQGGRLDDVSRCLDLSTDAELARLVPVHAAEQVRAIGDLDSAGVGPLECLQPRVEDRVHLLPA